MHSLSNLAYASRIASRIAYHVCIMLFELCTWLIVFRLLVCLVWVEPGDEFANKEPAEFAFEDPVNSDNFAGKMIIPSKSLLSLLCQFARSFAMPLLRCLPLACKPPKLPCQTSNPPLSQQTVDWLCYRFAQPFLQRCQLQVKIGAVPCWNIYLLVGISLYCYVILMHLYTW